MKEIKENGFNYRGNSIMKHVQLGVVLGWMTSWEILVLHLSEHHLDQMRAKYSIHSHERWVHVNHYLLNMGQ